MVEPDRPRRKPFIHAGNYIPQTAHRNQNQDLPVRLCCRSTGVSSAAADILPVPFLQTPRLGQPCYFRGDPPVPLLLQALPLPPASDDEALVPLSELDEDVAGVGDPDGEVEEELDEEFEDDELSPLAEDAVEDDLSFLALVRYESLR
jgi:hypothetical protein